MIVDNSILLETRISPFLSTFYEIFEANSFLNREKYFYEETE